MIRSNVCHEPAAENETEIAADQACSEDLKDMSMAQLRRLWRERMGRKDPPKIRCLLLRELAWHDQQAVQGGMDAQTRVLLRTAIKQANNAPTHTGPRPRNLRSHLRINTDLQAGTKLVRTWGGRKHEVVVLCDGHSGGPPVRGRFEYNGETFRGLTPIAEKITGAHWSGPRFFGLSRVRSVR